MANVFLKAEKIVSQGLGLLQRELVLPRLVGKYTEADFVGVKNDTLTVRIPSLLKGREYEWRTRTAPIEIDDLEEYSVDVTLNKHVYSAVQITDEQNTLDITSWGEQVARPQVRAVAEQAESYIAGAIEGANFRHSVTWTAPGTPDPDDLSFFQALVEARKHLNQENVPALGRVVVLGANAEAAALASPHLVKVDQAGFDGALREAVIGRIAGFTVIGNVNSLDPDFAVAMHPTAFAFANVAPVVPPSVPSGARETFESIALRWIRQYNSSYLREESVYSLFAGAASIEDGRDLESPVGSGYGELTDENVRAVEIEFTQGS